MSFVNRISYKISRLVTQMDMTDALIIVVCVVGLGLLCMRGFGSRTNY